MKQAALTYTGSSKEDRLDYDVNTLLLENTYMF